MKPLLEKYFYSFVQIYCGELQPNVTNSKTYGFDEIKAEIRTAMEKIFGLVDEYRDLHALIEKYSNLELDMNDEHPAIWGPGFIEPPGGLKYQNRFENSQNLQIKCLKLC